MPNIVNWKNPIRKTNHKSIIEGIDLPEEEIIQCIPKQQAEGETKLENQSSQSSSLTKYLKTREALWYWITIIIGVVTVTLANAISESAYPWTYTRNIFGAIFVLFLPGYSFTKALFQSKTFSSTSVENPATIGIVALSIGMSMAIVSVFGLLLFYSPLGLNLPTILLSLFAFTSTSATAAVILEHQAKKNYVSKENTR